MKRLTLCPGTNRNIRLSNNELCFRWCPPGEFMMGSPEEDKNCYRNEQLHSVRLTKGFWILDTPVTQKLYIEIIGNNPSRFSGSGTDKEMVLGLDTSNFPVENVTWFHAAEFCSVLSLRVKKETKESIAFKLPTEAQWEYACRAGTQTIYSFGGSLNGTEANCNGNNPCGTRVKGPFLARTSEVRSYSPNAWWLFDMHGNVSEYCRDYYDDYPETAVVDPLYDVLDEDDEDNDDKVIRGGGWCCDAISCRSASRDMARENKNSPDVGFRVVIEDN